MPPQKRRASQAKPVKEELPWLWLEQDEAHATAKCGCQLVRDHQESGDPAFLMCPRHKSLMSLKTAVESLVEVLTELPIEPYVRDLDERQHKAIKKKITSARIALAPFKTGGPNLG